MDFPLFFLDLIGNRLLMAVVAIIHVMVNHPVAVGAYPLVAFLEWRAFKRGDAALDELARKVTFVLFIVTTTVGALTGVGIWLTAALIAPFGIGSLLRVFFWAWFTEWLVFVSEVGLVLIYFLAWKRWASGRMKKVHVGVGIALAVMSWFTMAIIVAILGFMMASGTWTTDHSLFSALLNPLYVPQLAFRTAFALITAGFLVWFLLFFFTRQDRGLRERVTRLIAGWVLVLTPLWIVSAIWYWHRVPAAMAANLNVGLMTQAYANWEGTFLIVVAIATGLMLLTAALGAVRPRLIPRVLLIVPFVFGLYLLGHFERAREFIRKPQVVADYMYSNGVTVSELPIFQRDGILRYATYVKHRRVTETNQVEAGQDVFLLACSRCHTTTGVNGVRKRFEVLYGTSPWEPSALSALVESMHITRTFMPPFPGNGAEREALVAYVMKLQTDPESILGVQTEGIELPDSTTQAL